MMLAQDLASSRQGVSTLCPAKALSFDFQGPPCRFQGLRVRHRDPLVCLVLTQHGLQCLLATSMVNFNLSPPV